MLMMRTTYVDASSERAILDTTAVSLLSQYHALCACRAR
jgi:hypothetical protein